MAMTQDRYKDSVRFHEMSCFDEIKHLSHNRGFIKVCEVSTRNLTTSNFFFLISFCLVDFPLSSSASY